MPLSLPKLYCAAVIVSVGANAYVHGTDHIPPVNTVVEAVELSGKVTIIVAPGWPMPVIFAAFRANGSMLTGTGETGGLAVFTGLEVVVGDEMLVLVDVGVFVTAGVSAGVWLAVAAGDSVGASVAEGV